MTREEIEAERVKAFKAFDVLWFSTVNPKEKWTDPNLYEEYRLAEKASFAKGWLAAKKDAKGVEGEEHY